VLVTARAVGEIPCTLSDLEFSGVSSNPSPQTKRSGSIGEALSGCDEVGQLAAPACQAPERGPLPSADREGEVGRCAVAPWARRRKDTKGFWGQRDIMEREETPAAVRVGR